MTIPFWHYRRLHKPWLKKEWLHWLEKSTERGKGLILNHVSIFSGILKISSNFDNHHHRTNPKLGILVPEDNEAGQRVLVYIQVLHIFWLACHPT